MITAIRKEEEVEEDLNPVQLFVDCDENSYGLWQGTSWFPNAFLIGQIVTFRELYPTSGIYIWSGGGKEYAKECSERLSISYLVNGFLIKDPTSFHLVKSRDIVVDDDNLGGIRTHTPEDIFLEEFKL